MWENLPSHLRTGLAIALILVVGVAIAGFTLSFFALREVAANPITGWGRYAWIFPVCVDLALIAAEVAYITVSMIRGINRALPLFFMVLFGALTIWFNIERVPAPYRIVTAAPPVAGIFMTILLGYLLKTYARVTGRTMQWDAPAPAAYGTLSPYGPVHGSIHRGPAEEMPSVPRSRTGQIGQWGSGGGGGERGATRRAIETVASDLEPEDLTRIGPEGIAALVASDYGLQTTPGYVRKVLDGRAGVARNGHGKP
jgi:hypothetical protein